MGTFGSTLWGGGSSGSGGFDGTPLKKLLAAMLRKAGVTLAPGRGASPDQLAEAIGEINRMIGGWNLNPLLRYTRQIVVWDTIAQQKSYTYGPGGDWDGQRPQAITFANLFLPTDPVIRRPMEVLTDQRWRLIAYQDVFTYPSALYNDEAFVDGLSTVYLYPAPDAVYQIELYVWLAIAQFVSIEDVVILPDGFEDAIVNNGAVRLASMPWPVQVPMNPQVRVDAQISLALLQSRHAVSPRGTIEPALRRQGGVYNYLTGLTED